MIQPYDDYNEMRGFLQSGPNKNRRRSSISEMQQLCLSEMN